MGITQTELDAGVAFAYDVEVFRGPIKYWQIALVQDESKREVVETQRGYPKTWKSLDDALVFALEFCRDARGLRVMMGEYVLRLER